MRRPEFIARQSRQPHGWVGRAIARVMARETRAANEAIVRLLDLRPGDTALEVGFGHGVGLELAGAAAAGEAFLDGVDSSADMVRMAERRCARFIAAGRMAVRLGDSAHLPFPDRRFDKVFTLHTLYFWDRPLVHLRELGRVLRPDGQLLFGFRERSAGAVRSFPPPIYRFYSAEEVEGLLLEAGFSEVSIVPIDQGPAGVLIARACRRRAPDGSHPRGHA